uniref:Uncharacterized protein n=1 Tax=Macaca fascicularis TaxID=9541 RepID=A0A7N9DAY5_MACFA
CWDYSIGLLLPQRYLSCLLLCVVFKQCSRVHVHNVQVCYICILVPCCCAAPINLSKPMNSSFSSE